MNVSWFAENNKRPLTANRELSIIEAETKLRECLCAKYNDIVQVSLWAKYTDIVQVVILWAMCRDNVQVSLWAKYSDVVQVSLWA